MRDYADQIKCLRDCARQNATVCMTCGAKASNVCAKTMAFRMREAADAIEKLIGKACPHYHKNVHDRGDDSYCDLLNREVPKWISVEERLPEDGDIVLVYWYNVHCCERDNFSVMRFRKGRTAEELKQADFFRSCDQWGNNKKPYDWSDPHGPLSLFGQDVSHWMPLPKAPEPPKGVRDA